MPKRSQHSQTIAIQPPAGLKTSFKDEDPLDNPAESSGGVTNTNRPILDAAPEYEEADEDADEDDDEAPEAVEMSAGLDEERRIAERADLAERVTREKEQKRSRAIATKRAEELDKMAKMDEKKAKKRKVDRSPSPSLPTKEEDDDAKRLRMRMEKAMAEGSGDSADETDADEDEDELFHSASGSESEDEEADADLHESSSEGEDESDEELVDGPIDSATKNMRERMQAAMEAAERRAGLSVPKIKAKTKASKAEEAPPVSTGRVEADGEGHLGTGQTHKGEEEEDNYDLHPYSAKPLPTSLLQKAAQSEQLARSLKSAAPRGTPRQKRKRPNKSKSKAIIVEKIMDDRKKVHLLPPALNTGPLGGLPPIHDARGRVPIAGKDARGNFVKGAMRVSGKGPGKGLVDGRRRR